jgi:hypothetical protein
MPPKVCLFWWRVIKGYIPAMKVLQSRHMDQIAHCEACGAHEEMVYHALFECTWAKIFWNELGSTSNVKMLNSHPRSWEMNLIDNECYWNHTLA